MFEIRELEWKTCGNGMLESEETPFGKYFISGKEWALVDFEGKVLINEQQSNTFLSKTQARENHRALMMQWLVEVPE